MSLGDGMGTGPGGGEQPSEAMQQVAAEYKENPLDMSLEAIQHELDENQRMMDALQSELGEAEDMSDAMTTLNRRRFKLDLAKRTKQTTEVGQQPESSNS